ncbi:MAG TPA: AAA family ATPase [Candidatus Acidoferrales bacterium]|jgi:type II secretory pathway predicted ATPase ExeA|nr:AAA family ATPase [Candidatus Acidoferrales bacterium]
MFLNYFKLSEEPFGVTPDPRFLFLGRQHREAMASLAYGTASNRGFMALIAKPGMGKTSLLYHYLEGLRGQARTAFVFRTDCNSRELIRHILLDLGVDTSSNDLPTMYDSLNRILTEEMTRGRRFVLVIDEAQNLDEPTLESVRLLSNFETPWKKLMQIVIAGQPGLAEKLARPSLTQLRQRISLVMRLEPLDDGEISSYIDHRLWVAGCEDPRFFTAGARASIAEYSEGIPRNINNLCFNAMSLACGSGKKTIDREIVREVLADLDLESLSYKKRNDLALNQKAPPKVMAAGTARTAQGPRVSVLRSWFPKVVVASVSALVFTGTGGDLNSTAGRTAKTDDGLAAHSSYVNIANTGGIAEPLTEHLNVLITASPNKLSQSVGMNDKEISVGIDHPNVRERQDARRSRTAGSPTAVTEDLSNSVDPRAGSTSGEAGRDE